MTDNCETLKIERIKTLLEIERNKGIQYDFRSKTSILKFSSILIPLVCDNGKWHLLFTRRSDNLSKHQGQVSYPGGGMEPGDKSPEDTALRETFEEIGLDKKHIHIIGKMPNFITISDYLVTPIVSWVDWPVSLYISKNEVSHVFTIPIEWLKNPDNWEERIYSHPNGFYGSVIFYKLYQGELLWGISAKITVELLNILENEL